MGPLGGLFRLQLRDSIHGRLSRGLAGPVFVVVVLIILAILPRVLVHILRALQQAVPLRLRIAAEQALL